MQPTSRHAFTLLELLVVIGTIGIMAVLVCGCLRLPAKEGRAQVCRSNLGQLAQAFSSFRQDNGSRFPMFAGYVSAARIGVDITDEWHLLLKPYVADVGKFNCPEVSYPDIFAGNVFSAHLGYGVAYAYNMLLARRSAAEVSTPSGCLVLSDGRSNYLRWSCPNTQASQSCGASMNAAAGRHLPNTVWHSRRHGGGANYLFADGHVVWVDVGASGASLVLLPARPDMHTDARGFHP